MNKEIVLVHKVIASSKFCTCVLVRTDNLFEKFQHNCLYNAVLEPMKDNFMTNPNLRLVIHVKSKGAVNFLKQLYYSFTYRKQNNLLLREDLVDLRTSKNIYDFRELLLVEYFKNIAKTPFDSLTSLMNPIYHYPPISCLKKRHWPVFVNRVTVIPYIPMADDSYSVVD